MLVNMYKVQCEFKIRFCFFTWKYTWSKILKSYPTSFNLLLGWAFFILYNQNGVFGLLGCKSMEGNNVHQLMSGGWFWDFVREWLSFLSSKIDYSPYKVDIDVIHWTIINICVFFSTLSHFDLDYGIMLFNIFNWFELLFLSISDELLIFPLTFDLKSILFIEDFEKKKNEMRKISVIDIKICRKSP